MYFYTEIKYWFSNMLLIKVYLNQGPIFGILSILRLKKSPAYFSLQKIVFKTINF